MQPSKLRIKFHILYINSGFVRWHLTEHQFSSQMPLTLQTTTILAEFVGTKQRWSWYPAGVKIRHLPGKSSRRLGQFGARATRKIALRYSVSVGQSEKPLRPVPATAPRRDTAVWKSHLVYIPQLSHKPTTTSWNVSGSKHATSAVQND